jgi:6,7-dimethyl-8-ribityllumazine synthase
VGEKSAQVGSLEGRGLTIAVIAARYNQDITEKLLEGALAVLVEHGATAEPVIWVPGCIELPVTAQAIVETGSADAVVALGCVIKGDTAHFEHVAGQCAAGLMQVSLDSGIPVSFGVLTTYDHAQALARADKGREAAETALEMANLLRTIGEAALEDL